MLSLPDARQYEIEGYKGIRKEADGREEKKE